MFFLLNFLLGIIVDAFSTVKSRQSGGISKESIYEDLSTDIWKALNSLRLRLRHAGHNYIGHNYIGRNYMWRAKLA